MNHKTYLNNHSKSHKNQYTTFIAKSYVNCIGYTMNNWVFITTNKKWIQVQCSRKLTNLIFILKTTPIFLFSKWSPFQRLYSQSLWHNNNLKNFSATKALVKFYYNFSVNLESVGNLMLPFNWTNVIDFEHWR